ncbi:peptidoglycan-associated lipoprotein Pal [Comamonas faecalis]|uniref:Peptidoglycan-associated lipoprotein n=1 Tax=Comamonas faecalis TaxID=1387849 RepID=A0ABP7R2C3_9BURK
MNRLRLKPAALVLSMAAVLAGCSSGVNLDQVPVEDKGAISTNGQGGAGSGAVAPVDLTGQSGADVGPVGVERIVYFDFDSYAVRPEYQSTLEQHARFLKAEPSRKVMLEGNTDERGGREYNLALGQKRAEAVRRALAVMGVSDAQMEAVSFGKEKPAVHGFNEDAYAKNRRVELNYHK